MKKGDKQWLREEIAFKFDTNWLIQILTDDMGWINYKSYSSLHVAKEVQKTKLQDWQRQNYKDFTPADIRIVQTTKETA